MRKPPVVVYLTTVLVALTSTPVVRAAKTSDWGAVKQISEGQQIRIVLNDGKSYSGEFRSANNEAVSAHLNGDDQTFPRSGVRRISSKGIGHRGRNALIGAAIGGAAGLGIGAAVDRCSANAIACTGNKGKAIGIPLFGLLGAAFGAAIPTGRWHTIYQSH